MQSIEIDDDVVSHVIVRRGILRRIPQDRLVAFILERVKPPQPKRFSTWESRPK